MLEFLWKLFKKLFKNSRLWAFLIFSLWVFSSLFRSWLPIVAGLKIPPSVTYSVGTFFWALGTCRIGPFAGDTWLIALLSHMSGFFVSVLSFILIFFASMFDGVLVVSSAFR